MSEIKRGALRQDKVSLAFFSSVCPQVSFTALADKKRARNMLAMYM